MYGPRRVRRVHGQRPPGVDIREWEAEAGRHHADHRVADAAEPHRAADDRRIGVEASRPERMAQHHQLRRARAIVAFLEHASEERPRAEHVEKPIGHGGGAVIRSGGPSPVSVSGLAS